MDPSIDLDAYLIRIGYSGPRVATFATLSEVLRRHVCTIPFENLDIHLGRPIRLDLASIETKLVRGHRGGYCFEQNALLQTALVQLGFDVTPLIARVRWQVPAEVQTAQTHMILLISLAGFRYIVDAGFGSNSLTAPLSIDSEAEQLTPHDCRRVLRIGDTYLEQLQVNGAWSDLCSFHLQRMYPVDYEVANWYTSTLPQSRFKENLVVALSAEGRRHTLLNREFTTRWTDGRTEKKEIATPAELLEVLRHYFRLEFPQGTRFGQPGSPWPA